MSTEIVVFKEFEAGLSALEDSNSEKTFPDTTEGIDDRRKWYRKLRKATNALDKLRKETGADYLKKTREVNAEAKDIQVRLDVMELPHKIKLDRIEAAIQKEIDDLAEKNRLAAELEVDERLAYLEYGERKLKAAEDKLKADADAVIAAQKVIDDAEALKVAEDKAAEEATKKAETAAAVKTRAVADKIVADELEAKNKKDAEDEIERVRVANVEHRKEVEQAIIDNMSVVIDECLNLTKEAMSQAIVDAIVSSEIPHIEIVY
jgi:hypothetical protein